MGRLRAALMSQFADSDTKVHMPRNCEPLELSFTMERVVKVGSVLLTEGQAQTRRIQAKANPISSRVMSLVYATGHRFASVEAPAGQGPALGFACLERFFVYPPRPERPERLYRTRHE